MKIAVVHDWLADWAGAERVLEQILLCFPDADLFSLVDFLSDADRSRIGGRHAATSFIQRLPFARHKPWRYLPLMPIAIEQFDLSAYDLIISSSHAVAKGVITGPDQVHVCYVHSPMRYAWDLQREYLRGSSGRGLKGLALRGLLHYLRIWDVRTAHGVDAFAANSAFIARRIRKAYGREACVIHPPVDVSAFQLQQAKQDFYLCASRLMPYKRVPMIAAAFSGMPHRKLLIIGDGPDFRSVRRAAGPNVVLLGYQSDDALRTHLCNARALVFAAEEDFGILPVEAQACGTPVIAYGRGGVRETVRDLASPSPTGVFFHSQSVAAVMDAVDRFERDGALISAMDCRLNSERFCAERFRLEFQRFVAASVTTFPAAQAGTSAPDRLSSDRPSS